MGFCGVKHILHVTVSPQLGEGALCDPQGKGGARGACTWISTELKAFPCGPAAYTYHTTIINLSQECSYTLSSMISSRKLSAMVWSWGPSRQAECIYGILNMCTVSCELFFHLRLECIQMGICRGGLLFLSQYFRREVIASHLPYAMS